MGRRDVQKMNSEVVELQNGKVLLFYTKSTKIEYHISASCPLEEKRQIKRLPRGVTKIHFPAWKNHYHKQSFKQFMPATIPFCSRLPTISGTSASIHHTAKPEQNSITEDAQENTIQIGKYMGLEGLLLKGCSLGSEFLWHVTRW